MARQINLLARLLIQKPEFSSIQREFVVMKANRLRIKTDLIYVIADTVQMKRMSKLCLHSIQEVKIDKHRNEKFLCL